MALFTPTRNTSDIGANAENQCLIYLSDHGLKKLDKNFHSKMGEIDLIMEDKKTIVFVEVRYRSRQQYGTAIETVHFHKRKKIVLTAQYYLQKNSRLQKYNCRFDILGVSTYNDQLKFNWLKNAFTLDDI